MFTAVVGGAEASASNRWTFRRPTGDAGSAIEGYLAKGVGDVLALQVTFMRMDGDMIESV